MAASSDIKNTDLNAEKENKEILNAYRGLLRTLKTRDREQTRLIRKAFNLAVEAHKEQRRKSGEPYIHHPIAVARICSEEIGLGPTSVICALLHDTVEDTNISLEDIREVFGKTEMNIVDGLTKISGIKIQTESMQAENFRKILLTISEDVRVILIKIADRLHNMRTLGMMRRDKQLKIASETLFLYAPLAHRLGLYNIKSELEDLSFKYKSPTLYNDIENRIKAGEEERKKFIKQFIAPIRNDLKRENLKFKIKGRTKGTYSIYRKMQTKNVAFDEVYDLFAIRIIIDTPPEQEKAECWKAYSIVTDNYQPNPDRLRDWISIPKSNGYESLHTTVMSSSGRWVEVQVRSVRMDEQAEKGYAAHWRYKDDGTRETSALEAWMNKIRDVLEDPDSSALDFVYDFKLNLVNEEIYLFTPDGDMRVMPKGSTTLDFAFDIHTELGEKCIGAKVNHKLMPLSHVLESGDQVEIITSKKQSAKDDWLKFVVTGKARTKIKQLMRTQKRKLATVGRESVQRRFRKWGVKMDENGLRALQSYFKQPSELDLFYHVAKGNVNLDSLGEVKTRGGKLMLELESPKRKKDEQSLEDIVKEIRGSKDQSLLIGDDMQRIDYTISSCCNPIPGDDVFGFITVSEGIKIHRVNCPNATYILSNFAYRIVKARWKGDDVLEFLAAIRFSGIDDVGLVNKITNIISHELHVNMRSISFESNDGVFEGMILAYVQDTDHLQGLIDKLMRVNGVRHVERVDE